MILKNSVTKAVKALVSQSYPTLWDPIDCSPLGSSVHEIFLGKILEWVAISFKVCVQITYFMYRS